MKRYETSETLSAGDYVEHRGVLYIVEPLDLSEHCTRQCDAIDTHCSPCTGFCLRWQNGGEYVFKRVEEPEGDYVVKETRVANIYATCTFDGTKKEWVPLPDGGRK